MPYILVWIHLIWATKNREPIMSLQVRNKIFSHIRMNAQSKEIVLDCINGWSDHVHILARLSPSQSIAKIAQLLKGESSHWVNKNNLLRGNFEWQDEYIALSVSESNVNVLRRYIARQEEHHRKKSFLTEYEKFLKLHCFDIGGLKPDGDS
jgi:putative transposase